MTVKELILKLYESSKNQEAIIKVCAKTELIGGRCMNCFEDFDIDTIGDIITILPKGKKDMYDEIESD